MSKQVMQYQLLKDLPWMKAGTIVEVKEDSYMRLATSTMGLSAGTVLSAGCYDETEKYFINEDTGLFEADGVWFAPLPSTEEIELLEEDPKRMEIYILSAYAHEDQITRVCEFLAKTNKAINQLKKRVRELESEC